MHVLVAGWFSFTNGHATAGDLLSSDLVCEWLAAAGYSVDRAFAPPFVGGVDWRTVDPHAYAYVVFVCGPFQKGELEAEFLGYFSHCRIIGLNLSMPVPLETWNPFDLLIARDSSVDSHPDLVFLTHQPLVPVVGVCLVEQYEGVHTEVANVAIERLVASREMAVVPIDTRLDSANSAGLRTAGEIESLVARMDVVITTRLHGSVLALKNGVPVIAIDPAVGGTKVQRQMGVVGWPIVFTVDALDDNQLRAALSYCLTPEARVRARACYTHALRTLEAVRDRLLTAVSQPDRWDRAASDELHILAARTFTVPPEEPDAPPPPPANPVRRFVGRVNRAITNILQRDMPDA